jgi:anti-sigma-K factor RskA
MKYDDPQLRRTLASRYVLGTMPRLARARFDRLIAEQAVFCAEVRDWAETFAPLDAAERSLVPPPRVWQAIEAELGDAPVEPRTREPRFWWDSLALWRGAAGLAAAAVIALVVYIGVVGLRPPQPLPAVVAVLTDKSGVPAWVARSGRNRDAVVIRALARQTIDATHSYELWAIASGPPQPLGLVSPEPGKRLVIDVSALPPTGGVLAISLEPAGGSPTGAPTGPVLFQGKIFSNPL